MPFCKLGLQTSSYPRSPGTHIVGPWVTDTIYLYRDFWTGTQYIGNWASRDRHARLREVTFTMNSEYGFP